ncbi:MAG: TRAP transporter large permease [Rhizobiales bacterium]|nr:TRAP transporter large permease [Hyphomicrobiales bacterium]
MLFLLILAGLILILLTGLPVFAALGLFSMAILVGTEGNLGSIGELVFSKLNSYLLVALPLFALMASFMIRGRLVDDLFNSVQLMFRHLPGGLAVAAVAACTVFAAISGSSVATALTIGSAAIPLMIRHGYEPKVAYGVIGGGGTLGILIPPSAPMVIFGVASDTSIGALFMAGVLPGLMIAGMFAMYCIVQQSFSPKAAQRMPRATMPELLSGLRKSVWAFSLPMVVLGGMYAGIFTATEGAAIGAFAALVIGVFVYRTLGAKDIWASAFDAAKTTAMLFMILVTADMLGHVLTKLRIPQGIVQLVTEYGLGQIEFLLAVMALIFVLGMFLETLSIILITTPVVLPVLAALNINPVWYGILLTINLELALITPPVGMNLFALKAISKAPIIEIIKGVSPYVVILVIALLMLMFFPQIALWLPGTMKLGL